MKAGRTGFTLLELLASMAVLSVLAVMIVSITGEVFRVIQQSNKLEARHFARFALDRLESDWKARAKSVRLKDTFVKQPGNDEFRFVTSLAGFSGTRPLSVTGYRVHADTDTRRLQRAALGYNWKAADPAPDHNPVLFEPGHVPVLADQDYESLVPHVIRWEFSYLLKDELDGGKLVSGENQSPHDTNVEAILVTVALLDDRTIQSVPVDKRSALLTQLGSLLGDAADGTDSLTEWQKIVDHPGWAAGVGASNLVAQSVQLQQRILYK